MGYDVQLLDTLPDHLKCPICLTAFEDAMQTICGHLFCKPCLKRLPVPECSVCKEPLHDAGVFPDRHVQREVMVLKMKCPQELCGWKGELKDFLENHSKTCDYERIQCPHVECGASYLRKDRRHHEEKMCKHRMMQCKRCKKQVPAVLMQDHNEKDCLAGLVHCPAKCGRTLIQRSTLLNHLRECPLGSVECPFSKVGCKKKLLRHEARHHLIYAVNYHADLLVQSTTQEAMLRGIKTSAIQKVLHDAMSDPGALVAAARSGSEDVSAQQQQQIERLQSQLESLQNQVREQGQQAVTAKRQANPEPEAIAEAASLAVALPDAAASDRHSGEQEIVPWVHRLEDNTSRLEQSLMHLSTNIADLELRVNMCEVAAYNGVLTWKVTRWRQRLQYAASGQSVSLYSPPFYTGYHGYKCCARLYPYGDGAGYGSHASLFFVLMQNDYDATQQWPFELPVTFTLINQTGKSDIVESFTPDRRSNSFQRPVESMNTASGCPEFADLKLIEDPTKGFLTEEDCIFIKVEVGVLRGTRQRGTEARAYP